jgi:hypothetical protein
MEICIDFDGTCVTHDFPKVGRDIGAAPVLKRLVENGHNLILFTMRSDHKTLPRSTDPAIITKKGNYLTDAVNWFKGNEIPLYGIQANPTQRDWTESPKAYGQLYIDDAALGCPLVFNEHGRPYVDWQAVENMLEHDGLI